MGGTTGVLVRALVGAVIGGLVVVRADAASGLADRPLVVALAVLGSAFVVATLPMVQGRARVPGAVPALLGVAQFAIYCCVPETDQIPEVVGAVVVLLAVEVAASRALWWWLVAPVLGLVLWSGLFGATGRDSAIVGTLFAFWPLLLAGAVAGWRRGSLPVAAAIGSVSAVGVARTGALQPSVGPALVAVAAAVGVTALVVIAGADRGRGRPV